MSTPARKAAEARAEKIKLAKAEVMEQATAAGFVSPYPQDCPPGTVDDVCDACGWVLFVSLRCAVYCINAKCSQHQRDLRADVESDEEFCDDCHAGMESSEHHEKCWPPADEHPPTVAIDVPVVQP